MKRFWAGALLALLLTACTGTTSFQPPRLLIATYGPDTAPRLALVMDNGPQPQGSPVDRLEFLTDSVRQLDGQAVALDFVDRAGARSELVLLLHEGANEYSLAFLNTVGIDPAAPAAFERSRTSFPLNSVLTSDVAADPANLCLTDVQVTLDGRYAVLLNGGSVAAGPSCPDSVTDAPELFIVDLAGVSPALSINPTTELLAVRPYLDQGVLDTEDQLLYLVGANRPAAQLWSVALFPPVGSPSGSSSGTFGGGSTYPLDLTARGREEGMLALRSSGIELLLPDGKPAATGSNPVRFIRDPYVNELRQVLVLRSGGYSVHRDPADTNRVDGSIAGVTDATVDPDRDYVYFLSAGAITILDLLGISDPADLGASSRGPDRFRIPELESPAGLISWIPAGVPAAAP